MTCDSSTHGSELRSWRRISTRPATMPALYALPGMRHRLDARLQAATTIMFGVFFVIAGVAVVIWG
jgi:hypothetical protein